MEVGELTLPIVRGELRTLFASTVAPMLSKRGLYVAALTAKLMREQLRTTWACANGLRRRGLKDKRPGRRAPTKSAVSFAATCGDSTCIEGNSTKQVDEETLDQATNWKRGGSSCQTNIRPDSSKHRPTTRSSRTVTYCGRTVLAMDVVRSLGVEWQGCWAAARSSVQHCMEAEPFGLNASRKISSRYGRIYDYRALLV